MCVKKQISIAIALLWATLPFVAQAVSVPNGNYEIQIVPTPTIGGTTFYNFGVDGAWNSSFTFGGLPPSSATRAMTDNGDGVFRFDGFKYGSSVAGDGLAGRIKIAVNGSSFITSSFQVDSIPNVWSTPFAQWNWTPWEVYGTISQTTGKMTLRTDGRAAAFGSNLMIGRFNVENYYNPSQTTWSVLTTASVSTSVGSIRGAPLVSIGDVNGDGRPDFKAILVSAGTLGTDWSPGTNLPYFETWSVKLISAP